MANDLPEFYFRVRENGATVFRVDTENRQRRIEMSEIAVINVKNGQVRPHGDHATSTARWTTSTSPPIGRKPVPRTTSLKT